MLFRSSMTVSAQRTKQFKKLIRLAQHASKRGRIHLMRRAPNWFIRALVRLGSLYANGQLSPAKMRKLKRYRSDMHALARCRNNMHAARTKLIQRGGLLPLLPIAALIGKALLGAAAGAAGSAIIRKITGGEKKSEN